MLLVFVKKHCQGEPALMTLKLLTVFKQTVSGVEDSGSKITDELSQQLQVQTTVCGSLMDADL